MCGVETGADTRGAGGGELCITAGVLTRGVAATGEWVTAGEFCIPVGILTRGVATAGGVETCGVAGAKFLAG